MSAVPLGVPGSSADVGSDGSDGPIHGRPGLRITLGGEELQRVALDKRIVTIGRHPDNDIVLDADGVSRHHLQIITVQGESLVEDLGSRNGTYVNNAWMRVRQLRSGDEIVVAKFRLRFMRCEPDAGFDVDQLLRRWGLASARSRAIPTVCSTCGATRSA
ncbi:MAG: FHA domain-containing protein [Pseudomonadota bacterium]